MHRSFGSVSVSVKYTYARGNTIIYQRAVPTALRDRYPGKTIKIDLKTSDLRVAAAKVEKLNKTLEAEWSALIASPDSTPKSVKAHATALLHKFGLKPGDGRIEPPPNADFFFDYLDGFLVKHAGGDEETYRDAAPREYLPAVELAALDQLRGDVQPLLSDALDRYISDHDKCQDIKFVSYQRRAFQGLIDAVGDKPVLKLTREDVRSYISTALAGGQATGTVRRRLNTMRAVINNWLAEHSIHAANPFDRIKIPNEGADKKKRTTFTPDELHKLYAACQSKDDDIRWLLALMIDTGPRLSEVTGLLLSDIVLDAEVPHVHIQPHPWRSLKNSKSSRTVPLVGASLWAAQQVKANAIKGQKFAFPRYTSENGCAATSASNSVNQFIASLGMDHVNHELRHTMADRLRNVGCPKDIRYAIDGHASQDVGDGYGHGFMLPIMAQWLNKGACPNFCVNGSDFN